MSLTRAERKRMLERDAHQLHCRMIGMKKSRLSTEIQFAEMWSMEELRSAADALAHSLDVPVFRSRSKIKLAAWVNLHAHAFHDQCNEEIRKELENQSWPSPAVEDQSD